MTEERTYERKGPARPKNPRNYVVWPLPRREWSEAELLKRLRERGLTPTPSSDPRGCWTKR